MQAPAFCIFCHYAKKRACSHARPAEVTSEPAVAPQGSTAADHGDARRTPSAADAAVMH